MYIKQVIIQGFRSYRDQTIIDPFSSKHNVIVGRNGSGKSNFFFAIQFVLSADEFSNLRQEERQALLHEGTGPRVVSAFVEIIFDNSDNRIPIDKEEVSLRRVIGSKKDQYFLDKKNVTKSDVMNLLESAGFSRSNPYYIVKQGRINQLAIAKDNERLKLLREVAGTRVYDERKEESKQILKETEGKKEKIQELLRYIEEKLETLQEEKEELKAFQKWDKERRCLEYTIHDRELRETREKLEELESTRQDTSAQSGAVHKEAEDASVQVERLGHRVKELSDHSSAVSSERQQLQEECQQLIQRKTKLELGIKDLETSVTEDASSRKLIEAELRRLEVTIGKTEEELAGVLPDYRRQKSTEEELTTRLHSCEQRRSELYAKQSRKNQFASREERDNWIRGEMASLGNSISHKKEEIGKLTAEVTGLRAELERVGRDIKERTVDLKTKHVNIEDANKALYKAKKEIEKLTNERKELWRREAALDQSIQSTREEQSKLIRNLRSTVGKHINNGKDSVSTLVNEGAVEGQVYGPLIENFKCPEKFYTAVEVTAGNRLFHMIVDTDRTAAQVLSAMNRRKMPGEVTFMPLNKIQPKEIPVLKGKDYFPLLDKIDYDQIYAPVMQLVFGKTLVCRDLEVASEVSKSENVDCITLDGDQVSRRGALTGGYYDSRKSRLDLQCSIRSLEAKLDEDTEQSREIKEELTKKDGEITKVLGEQQKIISRQQQLTETNSKQKMDVKAKTQAKQTMEQALNPKEGILANLQTDLQSMQATLKSLSDELGTELMSQLNASDQQEVDRLNAEIQQLQERLKTTLSNRTELEGQKNTLENMLSSNLNRRRDELQQSLEELAQEGRDQELEASEADLNSVKDTIEHASERLEELDAQMARLIKEKEAVNYDLEKWKGVERERLLAIQEDSKNMERIANKRSLLMKKKDECVKKIRELGSLPSDAFDKYQKLQTKAMWKKLHKCNEELKRYSHVNKKALDQFVNFSEQKEKLMKRKAELDTAFQSIVELMDVLEQRKHEAILFTFKQVTRYFSDVFKQLVSHGKAALVMKTDQVDSQDEGEESGSSQRSQRPQFVDQMSGISIKVSFTGKSAETREMNQLSGGQKSLVALALIFAIQKCDPAPFYLFDEIDQALDPQFRKAVAEMIRKLSEKAQFITTTFRPELLDYADKFYGVKFRNKVSHVDAITAEQAKDFIEDDAQEK